jgi:16S rRNA (cytosine967-C5)-methyltransferase
MAIMKKTDLSARNLAIDVLSAILRRRRPLDQALEAAHGALDDRLEGRDAAFARLIVATTLRRLGQIDTLIAACLERPLTRKGAEAEDILRIGCCQLLFLGTPPHAAVNTSVALAEKRKQGPYKKLINAVLRRMARDGNALLDEQDAVRLNTPDWLWTSWKHAFGKKRCRAIAEAHLKEPPLDITAKDDAHKWAEPLDAHVLQTGSLRRKTGGNVSEYPGFSEGAWWVQDAAAALPVRFFGDIQGQRVIDLCAAPGGKTAQLIAAGARVSAVDRSEKRLLRVKENLDRLNLKADALITADAATWRPQELADAVLLDAPCSSTGTIRRRPDVAWLKTREDVENLANTQARLLAAAIDMVRPGGTIIYCSCSLQQEEGPKQIEAVLSSDARAMRIGLTSKDVCGLEALVDANRDFRSLPCHLAEDGGIDGFYAARLRRL